MSQRLAVVIDYQNIHLTGHDRFCPEGLAKHESLIHPLHFSNQLVAARTALLAPKALASGQPPPPALNLERVVVHRGQASQREDATMYRRNQAQRSEWTRDARVEVYYRPLRYMWENGYRVGREKGVDVRVALDVVRLVEGGEHDVVILAAHDTDLEPALEYAVDSVAVKEGRVRIETAGWQSCKRLKAAGTLLWHTFMNGEHFVRSRDRKDYT